MSEQHDRAQQFHALHKKGDPLVLFNIWDAGSAKAVADAGAMAIATGSAPVAMANGYPDGEQIPLDLALENISRIISAVSLPVSMDLEGGYGVEPKAVANTVARAVERGIVALNFEDQIVGGDGLHAVGRQVERVKAARTACEQLGIDVFINARTDIFLKDAAEKHNEAMLQEAIERANAYAQAGASGFFAPGLRDESLIRTLCDAVNLPVNIIALPGTPARSKLAELGVARVSHGPVPYRQMIAGLSQAAAAAFVA